MLREAVDGGYCFDLLSEATLEEWYLDPTFVPTYNGKVAMWRAASWAAKDYFDDMLFTWDIYPGPSGITGGNTDIGGIASTSEHKAAAYQLLKWMSFSEEGLLARYQIYEDYADQVYISANNYGYPVVDYGIDDYGINQIWETIPYDEMAPGFTSPEFIESLRNGAYWINKETVGWDEAHSVVWQYLYQVLVGETTFAAISETMQTQAMTAFNSARTALDALIEDLN
jgi:ABC-type glycerol-3-phosphate transport system substrate-binding protein